VDEDGVNGPAERLVTQNFRLRPYQGVTLLLELLTSGVLWFAQEQESQAPTQLAKTVLTQSVAVFPDEDSEYRYKRNLEIAYNKPVMREGLKRAALELGVIGANEQWYYFHLNNFGDDLLQLQKRYEKIKDAPPLGDARRFPTKQVCKDLLDFNRQYYQYLETQYWVAWAHQRPIIDAAKRETDQLYRIWSLVQTAQEEANITARRERIRHLL
jgi:hypothetical protein